MEKKLYKNTNNKIFAGVLSGLAEYVNLDPTIVRILYVLLAFMTELGYAVIIYIVLAIVLPEKSKVMKDSQGAPSSDPSKNASGSYHTYESSSKENPHSATEVSYRENPTPDEVHYRTEEPKDER